MASPKPFKTRDIWRKPLILKTLSRAVFRIPLSPPANSLLVNSLLQGLKPGVLVAFRGTTKVVP